jgi:membrane-associated phospholipid phosphatase
VVFCIAYVDRPVADWAQANIRPTALYRWMEAVFMPLTVLGAVFFVCFLGTGAWALTSKPLPRWTATPLLCTWAVTWALAVTTVLKRFVGRSEADPTWIVQHVYEFRWFHGKPDYQAFPSGTTALASAAAAVLWLMAPRLRAAVAGAVILIGVALVMINSHWVADIIGGAFLGVSIGWMTVRLRQGPA